MRIVLTGGKGGHLTPLEPIIEALRDRYATIRDELPHKIHPKEFELYFLGVLDATAKDLFSNLDVPAENVPAAKLRRYFSHLTILDILFRLPIGLAWAIYRMWRIMPDVVVSKGGYGSMPVVLAATLFRIPVLLHESDVTPGLANSLMYRFATTITVTFAETIPEKYKDYTFVTGIPIRAHIGRLEPSEAKQQLGIQPDETVLLVLGGSQGSRQLNELLLQILPELVVDTTVLHITGESRHEAITAVARELLAGSSRPNAYKAYPYVQEGIGVMYAAADVVVARAGATTLAELARSKKPTLLVPLAGAANDHQRSNAARYEQAGAARVLEPANLGKNLFARSVRELLDNSQLRAQLSAAIAQFDHPNAARDIAELSFRLASGYIPTHGSGQDSTA